MRAKVLVMLPAQYFETRPKQTIYGLDENAVSRKMSKNQNFRAMTRTETTGVKLKQILALVRNPELRVKLKPKL